MVASPRGLDDATIRRFIKQIPYAMLAVALQFAVKAYHKRVYAYVSKIGSIVSRCKGSVRQPMSHTIHLRPAHFDDIATLTQIRRVAILTLTAPTLGQEAAQHWADAAASNRVQRALKIHQVWVAECMDAAVGWVEVDGDHIAGMYVQPKYAGQGIGSALLAHAEGEIRAAGYSAVRLAASWNAEAFYLRRGYRPLGERSVEEGRAMMKRFSSRDD